MTDRHDRLKSKRNHDFAIIRIGRRRNWPIYWYGRTERKAIADALSRRQRATQREEIKMGVWVIDVYCEEADKTPTHRALVSGNTEQDALLAAAEAYPNDKIVVSIGRAVSTAIASGAASVRQLW